MIHARTLNALEFHRIADNLADLCLSGVGRERAQAVAPLEDAEAVTLATRIYEEARNKVATAFVEGRDLLFKGGDFYFEKDWYKCNSCQASFSDYSGDVKNCPVCKSEQVISLNDFYQSK